MRKMGILLSVLGVAATIMSAENTPREEAKALSTSIFPIRFQNNVYNLCESFPGCLLFKFTGDQKKLAGKSVVMSLELPEGIEYVGSSGYLPSNIGETAAFAMDKFAVAQVDRSGRKYNRYEITIDPAICKRIGPKEAWCNFERLYLQAGTGTCGLSGNAFWEIKAGDESCGNGSFAINILPPLKTPTKKCSRFGLAVARMASLSVPKDSISDAWVGYWTGLHARPITFDLPLYGKYESKILRKISENFVFAMVEACGTAGTSYFITNFAKECSFPPLIDKNGNTINSSVTLVAPWYLIEDPDGLIWDKAFAKYAEFIKKSPVKVEAIIWDLEPGAMGHGFSGENREKFKEFAGLDKAPSVEEINKHHANKWFAFRVEQHHLIIQRFSKAMRKYLPEVKFVLCSDPVHAGKHPVADWCGVDVRLSDEDVDLHMHMPYYAGLQYYNDIEFNLKSLKKPNFPLIDPAEDMDYFYSKYSPEKVKQNVLASAALGCVGIGFWPEDAFDGRYLARIAEGFDMVAQAEDFYFASKAAEGEFKWEPVNVLRKTFKNEDGTDFEMQFPNLQEKVKVMAHKHAGQWLFTALNYDNANPAIVKLSLPEAATGWHQVLDIGSDNILTEGGRNLSDADLKRGFLVEVPSDGVKVIKVSPTTDAKLLLGRKALAQENLRENTHASLKNISANNDLYTTKQEGVARIDWTSILENGARTPYLKMVGKERCLLIDSKMGADIVGWQDIKNKEDDLLVKWGDRGFLGRLVLSDNSQSPSPYDFRLTQTSFSNGAPEAVFQYRIPPYQGANPLPNPMDGLEITKTVTFSTDGKECRLKYEFRNDNPAKSAMKFGFRVNNYPRIGAFISGNKTVSQIGEVAFTDTEGKTWKIDSAAPQDSMILKKGVKTSFDGSGNVRADSSKDWNGAEVIATAKNLNAVAIVKFIPDPKAAGMYVWHSTNNYTVEFVSPDIELPYGERETFTTKVIIEKSF